jgi:hydrogenase/urease accessory protein HupE
MAEDRARAPDGLAMMRAAISLLVLWWALTASAFAHEVRPAYLELRETSPDTYEMLWKVPARGENRRLGLYVRLPADARPLDEPRGQFANGAYIERSRFERSGGLSGQTIGIDGLSATPVDVLIRLSALDGTTQTLRATPDAPEVTIARTASNWSVAGTYMILGIEHILLGIDHLLFVFALVLLVQGWRRLLGTITAFTVAHSLTLAAATLGFVHLPVPPVEACIALSIAFVAAEIVRGRQGASGLTERAPWVVAFAFGLLHGLGFASALSEVGLPQHAIPIALLFFNVGVELGQLLFIGAVFALLWLIAATVHSHRERGIAWRQNERLAVPAAYLVGTVAMFWVVERTSGFLT